MPGIWAKGPDGWLKINRAFFPIVEGLGFTGYEAIKVTCLGA